MADQVAHEKVGLVAVGAVAAAVALVVGVAGAGADFPAETSRNLPGMHAYVGLLVKRIASCHCPCA